MTHEPRKHINVHAVAQAIEGKGTAEGVARTIGDARALREPPHNLDETRERRALVGHLRDKRRLATFQGAAFGKVAPELLASVGTDIGRPPLLSCAQTHRYHAALEIYIFDVEGNEFAGAQTRVKQEKAKGAVTVTRIILEDVPNVLRGECFECLLLQAGHLDFAEGRLRNDLIAHAVVEKCADSPCKVVLVLAGKLSTLEMH